MSNAPVHTIKVGNVQAAIWENSGKGRNGQSFTTQSVSFSANYQDKDQKWQSRSSFKFTELPYVLVLFYKLMDWKYLKGEANAPTQQATNSNSQLEF